MKIIVNRCFGGYGLSAAVGEWLRDNKGWNILVFNDWEDETLDLEKYDGWIYNGGIGPTFTVGDLKSDNSPYSDRTNLELIECVEIIGEKANSWGSELEVVTIPDDIEWEIEDYDGHESVHEKHRSW